MKKVMLKITGRIMGYEKGREYSEDVMEFITEGKMQNRGRTTMLIYPEMEDSGLGETTTYLTASPNRVRIRREAEGSEQTTMEFEKGKRFNGYYLTPYGPMDMEMLTNSIKPFGGQKSGDNTLSIDYTMSLKGLAETRNRLDIEIIKNLGEEENE